MKKQHVVFSMEHLKVMLETRSVKNIRGKKLHLLVPYNSRGVELLFKDVVENTLVKAFGYKISSSFTDTWILKSNKSEDIVVYINEQKREGWVSFMKDVK